MKCWCGDEATRIIKYKCSNIEVETPVCEKHYWETFRAITWKLVAIGAWFSGCLSCEVIPLISS